NFNYTDGYSSLAVLDLTGNSKPYTLKEGPLAAMAFSHKKSLLAVAGKDRTTQRVAGDGRNVKLWDVAARSELPPLLGHTDQVTSVSFSHDDELIASGSNDGTTRLWNAKTGKELCRLISFNDGNWAVVEPEGRF